MREYGTADTDGVIPPNDLNSACEREWFTFSINTTRCRNLKSIEILEHLNTSNNTSEDFKEKAIAIQHNDSQCNTV